MSKNPLPARGRALMLAGCGLVLSGCGLTPTGPSLTDRMLGVVTPYPGLLKIIYV